MIEELTATCSDCRKNTVRVTIPPEDRGVDKLEAVTGNFFATILSMGWAKVPDGFTFKYVCPNCARKYA